MYQTEIEFLTSNIPNATSSSTSPVTGDILWIAIALIAFALFAVGIYKFRKFNNLSKQSGNHVMRNQNSITKSLIANNSKVILTMSAIILSLLAIFTFINISNAFANNDSRISDSNQIENVSVTNKVYAKLDNNDKLVIENSAINNQNDKNIVLKNLKVDKKEQVQDDSIWSIKHDDNTIYQEKAGISKDLPQALTVNSHSTISLEISNDMSKEHAIELNNKIFTIYYTLELINPPHHDHAIEPSVNHGLIYNGQEQIGVNGNETVELTGDYAATDAGEYKAIAKPIDDLTWEDGTRDEKPYTWNIEKATPKLSIEQELIDVKIGDEKSVKINYDGDAEGEATIKDENIADASIRDDQLNITGKKAGKTQGQIIFKNSKNYKDISMEYAVFITKNYTGYIQFPLINSYGILDLFAYMNDLDFNWNPYMLVNANNEEYNQDIAKFAMTLNSDSLDGCHVELDGVPHWTLFDNTSLYEEFGMKDIEVINIDPDEYKTDKDDTAMLIISHLNTKINDKDNEFIIVTVCGTNVFAKNEFGSNLDVGAENSEFYQSENHPEWTDHTIHKGFNVTYNRVSKKITNYLEKHVSKNSNNTILFTGHSRGAALCNLLGKEYENKENFKSFSYCYATPNVTTDENADRYNTIFNIRNKRDIVTYVPPTSWGFHVYGKIKQGDIEADVYQNEWKRLVSNKYVSYKAEELINALKIIAESREQLYSVDESLDPAFDLKFDTKEEAQNKYNELYKTFEECKLNNCLKFIGPEYDGKQYQVKILYSPCFMTTFISNVCELVLRLRLFSIIEYIDKIYETGIQLPSQYSRIIDIIKNQFDELIPGFLCGHGTISYYLLPKMDAWIKE